MITRTRWIALLALGLALVAAVALALKNPAAAYCSALGYVYMVERTDKGDVGKCVLPGGQKVDAWQFLQGKVAPDKGYCASKGYRLKTAKDARPCVRDMTDSCAICVLPDGREVEVIELMGLHLEETVCGDGTCGVPENCKSCPADCPSGLADAVCDGVKDGRCDPECTASQDTDCAATSDPRPSAGAR